MVTDMSGRVVPLISVAVRSHNVQKFNNSFNKVGAIFGSFCSSNVFSHVLGIIFKHCFHDSTPGSVFLAIFC